MDLTDQRAYTTRVGRPRPEPARTYDELLALPSREQPDDGLVLGPWVTTAESGWDWNEGPCACGGILRWAEAGYVPWHRICDRCGSHWELHVIGLVPHEAEPPVTHAVAWRLPDGRVVTQSDDLALAGYDEETDPIVPIVQTVPARPRGVLPVVAGGPSQAGAIVARDGQRYQVVPPHVLPFYQAARALVRPEHITDEVLHHGVLYGGWASRARFYRG
jgi:hypothetical protein